MAVIYKCDRCHREGRNDEVVEVTIPYQYDSSAVRDYDNRKYDICMSCLRQLNEWLKPLPKDR